MSATVTSCIGVLALGAVFLGIYLDHTKHKKLSKVLIIAGLTVLAVAYAVFMAIDAMSATVTYKLASPIAPININMALYAILALVGIITMITCAPEIAKPNHKRRYDVAVVIGFFMTAAGLFFAFLR